MLAAECQSSNPYHVLILIAVILMNGATIDLITSRSSKEPEVQNGRRAFWALSPLPWAFATAYRKIRGVAAPVPLPWAIGYAICAAAMLAAHFLGQASQVLP